MSSLRQASDLIISGFEFDKRNLDKLAIRDIDDVLVTDVWADDPRVFDNPPASDRTASYLMIGMDANGALWTFAMIEVDDELHIWRVITGWPTTRGKELRAWRNAG